MQFQELNIKEPMLSSLAREGYTSPTPIQEEAIPPALEGRDILGLAQTGTGKTAAFAVPTVQLLMERPKQVPAGKQYPVRALILTPTRELAMQIYESFCAYGKGSGLGAAVIFGGVAQKPQEDALRHGVDILIATPGRLNDLIGQRLVNLAEVEILILDEADRMLDMGFLPDVKKIIVKTPEKKQTMLFSATMPREIDHLAKSLLSDPVTAAVAPPATTVEAIEQSICFVDKSNKPKLLLHLLQGDEIASALVFTRTKHGADRVARFLQKEGVNAESIHGNKSQSARQQALNGFKSKTTRVLVATDIAARGIDIEELSHVVNYDMPEMAETYVHRIGRTGRAGLTGKAIAFCDYEELELLRSIEKLTGRTINEMTHPFPMEVFHSESDRDSPSSRPARGAKPVVRSNRPAGGGRRRR